jgi:hypothetical protein
MFEESQLIDLIGAETGFATKPTSDKVVQSMDAAGAPRVYVGHKGIRVKYPEFLFANGYEEIDNPKILLTRIQIVCLRSVFVATVQAVQEAYRNFSPINNSDYSKLFFIDGQVLTTTESSIWYEEEVGLIYPAIV